MAPTRRRGHRRAGGRYPCRRCAPPSRSTSGSARWRRRDERSANRHRCHRSALRWPARGARGWHAERGRARSAVPWITPPPPWSTGSRSGSPSRSTHPVEHERLDLGAGGRDGPQLIPCTPSPADSSSPRIDGNERCSTGSRRRSSGCCQWVRPGTRRDRGRRPSHRTTRPRSGDARAAASAPSPGSVGSSDGPVTHALEVVGDPVDQLVAMAAGIRRVSALDRTSWFPVPRARGTTLTTRWPKPQRSSGCVEHPRRRGRTRGGVPTPSRWRRRSDASRLGLRCRTRVAATCRCSR